MALQIGEWQARDRSSYFALRKPDQAPDSKPGLNGYELESGRLLRLSSAGTAVNIPQNKTSGGTNSFMLITGVNARWWFAAYGSDTAR